MARPESRIELVGGDHATVEPNYNHLECGYAFYRRYDTDTAETCAECEPPRLPTGS